MHWLQDSSIERSDDNQQWRYNQCRFWVPFLGAALGAVLGQHVWAPQPDPRRSVIMFAQAAQQQTRIRAAAAHRYIRLIQFATHTAAGGQVRDITLSPQVAINTERTTCSIHCA
jgi:hypothetical protein